MDNNERLIFERDIYERVIIREFENRQYFSMASSNIWLTQRYGDYMTCPPIEERENGSCHEFEGSFFREE